MQNVNTTEYMQIKDHYGEIRDCAMDDAGYRDKGNTKVWVSEGAYERIGGKDN
jgi:hypothetical protein